MLSYLCSGASPPELELELELEGRSLHACKIYSPFLIHLYFNMAAWNRSIVIRMN